MKTNVAELSRGRDKIVRDSCGNVAPFDFSGAPAATKMCFKLFRDVCCDSDTRTVLRYQLTALLSIVYILFVTVSFISIS